MRLIVVFVVGFVLGSIAAAAFDRSAPG